MKGLILYTLLAFTLLSAKFNAQEVQWKTMEEAQELIKENPNKSILVDVYTTWCRWCKEMEKDTYADPKVAEYINENFIPVKWDAQQKSTVNFFGTEYTYNGTYNTLSYHILNNQLEFPATIFINEEGKIEDLIFEYLTKEELLAIMKDYNGRKK